MTIIDIYNHFYVIVKNCLLTFQQQLPSIYNSFLCQLVC